jgi:hypothetical protein
MRNYSICYLDEQGRTNASELLPFEDNGAATTFARIGLVRNAIVEVWREGDLVVRLFQPGAPQTPAEFRKRKAVAAVQAERHRAVDEWSNEGGASRPKPADGVHH